MSNLFRAAASLLWLGASSAFAAEYPVPAHDEMFGEVQVVKARYEDTFVAFAQKYNVGYEALKRANPGVDPWLPGEGTRIVIPTQFVLPRAPHRGIVVNVAELRLYYFPADTADTFNEQAFLEKLSRAVAESYGTSNPSRRSGGAKGEQQWEGRSLVG